MFYRLYKIWIIIIIFLSTLKIISPKILKKKRYLQICEIFWCSIESILMKYEMEKMYTLSQKVKIR